MTLSGVTDRVAVHGRGAPSVKLNIKSVSEF